MHHHCEAFEGNFDQCILRYIVGGAASFSIQGTEHDYGLLVVGGANNALGKQNYQTLETHQDLA